MGDDVYTAPTSASIKATQDEKPALRLLLAQRRLYRRAKRWAFLRTIGLSLIAVAAPIITAIDSDAAVVVGAVASLWVFLSRTAFSSREKYHSSRGAVVQETFDLMVFGMPQIAHREPQVSLEDISRLVGDPAKFDKAVRKEKIMGWYPVDTDLDGTASIAIAQRANAAYAERLLRTNAAVWLGLTIAWAVIGIVISLVLGFSFERFFLGVGLPLLPALLDVFEQWRSTRQAGDDRLALAQGIEEAIADDGPGWTPQDLLVWQEQLYVLRRDAPQIPNLVYRRTRKKNERAMNDAAADLVKRAKARRASGGGTS